MEAPQRPAGREKLSEWDSKLLVPLVTRAVLFLCKTFQIGFEKWSLFLRLIYYSLAHRAGSISPEISVVRSPSVFAWYRPSLSADVSGLSVPVFESRDVMYGARKVLAWVIVSTVTETDLLLRSRALLLGRGHG